MRTLAGIKRREYRLLVVDVIKKYSKFNVRWFYPLPDYMGLVKGTTKALFEIVDGIVTMLTGIFFVILNLVFLAVSIVLTPPKAIYNIIRNAFFFKKFKTETKELGIFGFMKKNNTR